MQIYMGQVKVMVNCRFNFMSFTETDNKTLPEEAIFEKIFELVYTMIYILPLAL